MAEETDSGPAKPLPNLASSRRASGVLVGMRSSSGHPATTIASTLLIGGLLAAVLTVVCPTGTADAGTKLSAPLCTRWKESGNHASTYRYCATFTKKSTSFSVTDQYQLQNTDPKETSPLACDVKKSHTCNNGRIRRTEVHTFRTTFPAGKRVSGRSCVSLLRKLHAYRP
jgi:hypothetical protein